jgi:TfoX/Sxy family transcriptional regulator of competence genes
MSIASDALADRLRPLLAGAPGIAEKKMFGGIGFMLHGNMAIGTTAKGELLVRIDPARQDEALARVGAYQMHMGARPMTGFIAVAEAGTPDDKALRDWIAYAMNYAETLPPK